MQADVLLSNRGPARSGSRGRVRCSTPLLRAVATISALVAVSFRVSSVTEAQAGKMAWEEESAGSAELTVAWLVPSPRLAVTLTEGRMGSHTPFCFQEEEPSTQKTFS